MVTILGSAGFIGSALLASMRRADEEVFAPLRNDPAIFERDLGDVIYAIGLTADFRQRPFDTVKAHVSVLTDILERAAFRSLTYLSSTRVYSGLQTTLTHQPLSVEPSSPSHLYNLTKLTGESICLHCGHPAMRVVRLSNVVGVGPAESNNFIDSLVRDAVKGHITLHSSPDFSKDYIQLEDVVDYLPKIVRYGNSRIYNLASGTNLTNEEWTKRLQALLGCNVTYRSDPTFNSFPRISISELQQEFSFSPRSALEVLPELIEYEQNKNESHRRISN
jgi:nucleoside-diphosphate-sugar epimerase